MTLTFTTSNPGPFGDTSDCNYAFIEKFRQHKRKLLGLKRVSIHIHGELERRVGFDMALWLSGTIDCKKGVQDCSVYTVSGKTSYGAKLLLRGSKGLIVLESEVDATLVNLWS